MSLKIFLPMGEKPPEEFGRGHNTSRYQQATAISLPLLKRVREEDLELLLFPPSSTTSLLIVIFASNLSSAPPPPFDSTLPSNTTTNNGSSNTPSTPAAAVTSTGSIADGSRLTTSSYPLLDGLLKANTRHPTNKTSRLEDLFLHRSNSNNIGTTTALPFPRSSSGTRIFTSDTVRSLPSSSRDNNTNVTHTTSNAVFDLQSLFLQPPTTSNTTKSKDVVSAGATSNNNNNNNNPTTTSSIANHSHHHIQTYDAAQLVQANSITINAFSCLNSPKQQGNTCSDTTTTAASTCTTIPPPMSLEQQQESLSNHQFVERGQDHSTTTATSDATSFLPTHVTLIQIFTSDIMMFSPSFYLSCYSFPTHVNTTQNRSSYYLYF